MDLSKVNGVGRIDFLPKKTLNDLKIDEVYKVTAIRQVKTMFGSRVVVHINKEFQMFLPTRFQNFFVQEHEQLLNLQIEVKKDRLHMKHLGNIRIEFVSNWNSFKSY